MRFYPSHPLYSAPAAKSRAWREYHTAVADFGAAHPRALAAWGRVKFHDRVILVPPGTLPVFPTPSLVAYVRESGTGLGHCNRAFRSHFNQEAA